MRYTFITGVYTNIVALNLYLIPINFKDFFIESKDNDPARFF